jgi:hypothetical protein
MSPGPSIDNSLDTLLKLALKFYLKYTMPEYVAMRKALAD